MALPEQHLQKAINDEVTGKGSEAAFARRLERNFDDLDKRVTALTVPLVTALPTSPVEGQEVYYAVTGGGNVVWHFRYDSTLTGSKWVFLGGPPLTAIVTTQQTTTSTSYAALTTAGPTLTLALAGDYIVELGARLWTNTAGGVASMSYDIGGTGAVDADRITMFGSADDGGHAYRRQRTTFSAVTLTAKYKTSAGTGSFADRFIALLPVRVT